MLVTRVLTTLLVLAAAVAGTMTGFGTYGAWRARAAAPAPPANPAPPEVADKDVLPIDKAVVYSIGPAHVEGVAVVSDVPPDVQAITRVYLNQADEFKQAKKDVSPACVWRSWPSGRSSGPATRSRSSR